jgi:hypothetical protein
MNSIQNFIAKSIVVAFILLAGALSYSSVQAYTVSPYQYQFSNNQQQYQVYSAPVQYQYQNQYYDQRLQMLLAQIEQLQRLLEQLQSNSIINVNYDWDYVSSNYDDSEVEIQTRSATDVDDDSAELRGRVTDFNRSDYADVWFEYGTVSSNLYKRTPITRIDEDEDEDFSFRIAGLRDDTRYYYRAVAEDDDEEKDYGSIFDFRTDDDNGSSSYYGDDEPDVTTRNAFDIDEDSARFEGEVDMNDFRNGEVFLVYGEDEDQVDDIADDYDSYSDVDEDGDDLQKIRIDSDLDGDSSYEVRVNGLDDNTDYYFALCVGYEDEDDDDVIECSSTRDFETD